MGKEAENDMKEGTGELAMLLMQMEIEMRRGKHKKYLLYVKLKSPRKKGSRLCDEREWEGEREVERESSTWDWYRRLLRAGENKRTGK